MAGQSSVFLCQLDMERTSLAIILLLLGGCDLPNTGIIGPGTPPAVSSASISPSIININEIVSAPAGNVDTNIHCNVKASDLDKAGLVSVMLTGPDGSTLAMATMHDDGVAPDVTAGDGVFSAELHLQVAKTALGLYEAQFMAANGSGFRSSTIVQSLSIVNSNDHAPTLSDAIVPDTVVVPNSPDTAFVVVSVTVEDQEGLADIASVTFTSRRPDSSTVGIYPMYDDGGTRPRFPFGLKSGDAVAGDGAYTLTIPLTSSSDHNTYRDFTFQATDLSGETAAPLTKRIFIR